MDPILLNPDTTKPFSPPVQPPVRRKLWKVVSASLLGAGLLFLKLKTVIFLLFAKFKVLMVNPLEGFGAAQLAISGGSMVVTIGAYAFKMGLRFAIGFVLLTVIHELGHALLIRAKGLRVDAMVFIPFVGGAVTLKDQPTSAFDDAQIGLAGPIAGTLASFGCLMVYRWGGGPLYLALAFAGFLLNVFNLLPIGPLDGGRIAGGISKWIWVLGGLALFYVMVTWKSPLLILVLILGMFQIYKAITRPDPGFYSITAAQRTMIGLTYFSLLMFLGYQTVVTHKELLALAA
ncbi:MAG TPA: site-2 protease family protein [Thermoanaerobaculia bacterium]|nr:site-2 protease family protein [Thermoanaerobaculia bacterium]